MTADPLTTARQRLVPGQPGEGGYRTLVPADGEQHAVRDDLAGNALRPSWHRSARPLLVIAQLSDTHVMDHQSPGRVELLDRYSDPDSPLRAAVGIVGTYRAQELFTYQVAAAMVRAVREIRTAPLSGAPIDFAVMTGDALLVKIADEVAKTMDQPLWKRLTEDGIYDTGRIRLYVSEHRLIYEAIVDDICAGRLSPGTQLRQEQLAERFHVSRQPVQQALLLLRNQGLLREFGDAEVATLIDTAVADAKTAPLPTEADLLTDVYVRY